MGVHGDPKNICPYCLKMFGSRQAVKDHQKAAKHRVVDKRDGAREEKMLAQLDNERRRDAKLARKAAR